MKLSTVLDFADPSDHLGKLVARVPALAECRNDVQRAASLLIQAFRDDHKLLVCGNGGSAADSEHIVGELMKGFLSRRPLCAEDRARLVDSAGDEAGATLASLLQNGLPAIALTSHVSLNTAVINDQHGDLTFAQQVWALGRPGDVLLGISTSGNAANVQYAAHVARAKKMTVIALTGRGGGRLAPLSNVAIRVPADLVYEIQEMHLPVYHALCLLVESTLFP